MSTTTNYLTRYVARMQEQRAFNFLLLLIYFLSVVLPHKAFGNFLNTVIFQGITRATYNAYVAGGAFFLLLLYSGFFLQHARGQPYRKWLGLTLILHALLAIIAIHLLFVINIECIHFVQYAIFAGLLFPLVNNHWQVLIIGVVAGAIDEAYQYFYLAPQDTSYYDFNDVVTNLIGLSFGLLLLRSAGLGNRIRYSFFCSPASYVLGGLLTVVLVCWFGNVLSIYPSETSSYQLVRTFPVGFWSTVHPQVTYHVIQPLEGLLLTGSLLGLTGWLLSKE